MQQVAFSLAAIISAILLIAMLAVGYRRLAQRPRLADWLLVVLLCAVWLSQVAINRMHDERLWQNDLTSSRSPETRAIHLVCEGRLWQDDLAVACGWVALAGFYWIRRLYWPLMLHGIVVASAGLVIAISLVLGGSINGAGAEWLSLGARVGSLFSLPFLAMILIWRWGGKTRTPFSLLDHDEAVRLGRKIIRRRTLALLGVMALLVMVGYGMPWLMPSLNWLTPSLKAFGDPLLNAAYFGNIRKVSEMLEAGADPNKRDSYNNLPLTLAGFADQPEIAKLLIAHGADPSIKGNQGMTPLLCAAYKGNVAVARVLLDHGASVNVADQYGFTPLMFAIYGPPTLAELLLDHGADVKRRDEYGWQPLHRALRTSSLRANERIIIVTMLLEHGADPNASGGRPEPDSHIGYRPPGNPNRGDTPLEIAESNGFTDIVALLKKHGAKKNMGRTWGQSAFSQ
jgi:ankyrin repeat protein